MTSGQLSSWICVIIILVLFNSGWSILNFLFIAKEWRSNSKLSTSLWIAVWIWIWQSIVDYFWPEQKTDGFRRCLSTPGTELYIYFTFCFLHSVKASFFFLLFKLLAPNSFWYLVRISSQEDIMTSNVIVPFNGVWNWNVPFNLYEKNNIWQMLPWNRTLWFFFPIPQFVF